MTKWNASGAHYPMVTQTKSVLGKSPHVELENRMSVHTPNRVEREINPENNPASNKNNPAENNLNPFDPRQIKSNREIRNDSNASNNPQNNDPQFNQKFNRETFHDITAPHLMSSDDMLNHQDNLINHQITITHYVSKRDSWFYCSHHHRLCYYVCMLCLIDHAHT
jgi:hypothetical protein